jgi:hypothetical protein
MNLYAMDPIFLRAVAHASWCWSKKTVWTVRKRWRGNEITPRTGI